MEYNKVGAFTCVNTRIAAVALAIVILSAGCRRSAGGVGATPAIEIMEVPLAEPGDANKLRSIKGRVTGAQPNQQIVLYAKYKTTWWVQPYKDRPFTKIQSDSTWKSPTHPGMEFAALLVGPEFRPPPRTEVLPIQGVVTSAVEKGLPPIWQRWWFLSICLFAGLCGVFTFYRVRLNQITSELNVRFDERLAERMRVAQILHDTLLQGVISASMQLHVAVAQLPPGSPALGSLNRVLQAMGQVVEEGRNTLRGLRSPLEGVQDLGHYFSRIPQELNIEGEVGFHVTVKGPARPLQSTVRVDLYDIGREVLVNAFRQSRAKNAEVELRYTAREFWLRVHYDSGDGGEIDPQLFQSGRERAERIGGRLKVRRSRAGSTEIELRVPSRFAFEPDISEHASRWFEIFHRRPVEPE